MAKTDWKFTKGLHEIGEGCFAYLQPDGSWGWSNAGLVTDGTASLLVDTLFDLKLTADMLEVMRDATPAAAQIDTLVNSHANGDHCYGNQLVSGAEIITSSATAEEMSEVSPAVMAACCPKLRLRRTPRTLRSFATLATRPRRKASNMRGMSARTLPSQRFANLAGSSPG